MSAVYEAVDPCANATVGWTATRLKYLFEYERNGAWGEEADGGADDVLCVRVADFDRLAFTAGAQAQTYRSVPAAQRLPRLLRERDVLLEKSGGTADKPVGCAVTYDRGEPAICSNFIAVLRPRPKHHGRYLGYLMACLYQTRRNQPFVNQTTGIQNLDSGEYLGTWTKVPDRGEQRRRADRLDKKLAAVKGALAEIDHQIALLAEHRQALISLAVTCPELGLPA
jgi:type I restriction enzyme S subunit